MVEIQLEVGTLALDRERQENQETVVEEPENQKNNSCNRFSLNEFIIKFVLIAFLERRLLIHTQRKHTCYFSYILTFLLYLTVLLPQGSGQQWRTPLLSLLQIWCPPSEMGCDVYTP